MTWDSVPVCDLCWKAREPGRTPARLAQRMRRRERCAHCGHDTLSGIYQRVEVAER